MKFRGDYANILLAGCIYTKKKVLHITIITVGTKYRVPHGRNNCLFNIQGKHKRTHAQHTHNTKNKQLGLISLSLQSLISSVMTKFTPMSPRTPSSLRERATNLTLERHHERH